MTAAQAGERGSTLLVVVVMAVAVSSLAVAARWSASVIAQSRVQTVADLSALAAAARGPESARAVSSANGARLLAEDETGGVFVVSVSRDGQVATAAARACTPLGEVPGAPPSAHEDRTPAPCR